MTEPTPTPIAAPTSVADVVSNAEATAKAKIIAIEVAINKVVSDAKAKSESFVHRYWPLAVGALLALTRFL